MRKHENQINVKADCVFHWETIVLDNIYLFIHLTAQIHIVDMFLFLSFNSTVFFCVLTTEDLVI